MFHSNLRIRSNAINTAPFKANDIATIYKFPAPSATPVTVSVISFGGGLFGSVNSSGVLADGDVHTYWKSIGIPTFNHPKVIVRLMDGASNTPVVDQTATFENTMDVIMLGSCCPTANLTIILFLAPNSLSEFNGLIQTAITPLTVDGVVYTPSIVSISWGAAEINYTAEQLSSIHATIQAATAKGINFCAATGDEGSTDGVPGNISYVDFPSSSPNVTACGGTSLVCPTLNYSDATTTETAWPKTGGGVSNTFAKPSWQTGVGMGINRCTPDIALVADPATGVDFIVGGKHYVFGGTSIVPPAVAAFYACLNTNKFLLPLLYSVSPDSFHDITSGSNGAYTATVGFDLCTGWGSIVGNVLTSQLLNVPVPPVVPITGIVLDSTSVTVGVGNDVVVTAVVMPTNATDKTVTWASTNPSVATVVSTACPKVVKQCSEDCMCGCMSGNVCGCGEPVENTENAENADVRIACDNAGRIRGVALGTTSVTASSGGFQASVTVVVVPAVVPVTGVTLNVRSITLMVGANTQLVATVAPSGATNKSVTWSSSSSILTVVNGLVTAVAVGTATVTVTTVDGGFVARVSVTVTAAKPITFSPSSISMYTYTRYQSILTNAPANVAYTSSSPTIATVSNTGLVTAYSPGIAVIEAFANNVRARLYVFVIGSAVYYSTKTSAPRVKSNQNFYNSLSANQISIRR